MIETKARELAGLKSELLAPRSADVRDVGRRVLRILTGAGAEVLSLSSSVQAILNGASGFLEVEPGADALKEAREAQRQLQHRREVALMAAAEPAITQDGHRMEIVANIGGVAESRRAVERGAEGIGLLRTEFLFLERSKAPTEDEQFQAYRDIAQIFDGQPVIVRTLDIGGDKPIPYLPLPYEENPFLGERGIRLCLNHTQLFRTQLRAILRASEHGFLRIRFPMIADQEELWKAKAMVEELQQELGV